MSGFQKGNGFYPCMSAGFSCLVPPVVAEPVVIQLQIGAGADDSDINDLQGFRNNQTSVNLGFVFGFSSSHVCLRFTGASEIAGKTITAATLTVFSANSNDIGDVTVRVYAEDADDPTAPVDAADFAARVLTTAFADWNVGAFVYPEEYTSPSLVDVLQELADRPGLGDAINLFVRNNGSTGERAMRTYEDSAAFVAILDITYE